MLTRRQLLQTGLGGAAALALATLLASPQPEGPAEDWVKPLKLRALTPRDAQLLAAIAPAVLGRASRRPRMWCAALTARWPACRQRRGPNCVNCWICWAILGRRWIAGVSTPWRQASADDISAFLRWRGSSFPCCAAATRLCINC